MQLGENGLAVTHFRARISLSANSFSYVCSFFKPEIQFIIHQSLLTPAHQPKALEMNKSLKSVANSWKCFIKWPCLNVGCLQLKTNMVKISHNKVRKSKSAIHFHLCDNKCHFMWAAFFVWVHINIMKCDVVVVIKIDAYIYNVLLFCLF